MRKYNKLRKNNIVIVNVNIKRLGIIVINGYRGAEKISE